MDKNIVAEYLSRERQEKLFYNVLIKTKTSSYYLIATSEDEISKIVDSYQRAIEGGVMVNSQRVFLRDILIYKIFDLSKTDHDIRGEIIDYVKKVCKSLFQSRMSEEVFDYVGKDVTEIFPLGEWGEKSVVAITMPAKGNYINETRIGELRLLGKSKFDLTKLIRMCEEVNSCNLDDSWFAVGALVRSIVDHVPPIFECKSFAEVANNYSSPGKAKSFKDSMDHLDKSMRKITDSFLHSHITSSETLPNENQVDCKRDLDVLLGEIVRILK